MKLLGHVYIATEAFPKKDKLLLAIGALLPELVFYTKDPVFSYEELHEGGLILYKYLRNNNPGKIVLAFGVLAHSYKYGADGLFNTLDDLKQLGFEKEDIVKTADALILPKDTAKGRVHNLYSLGVDYWLVKNKPEILDLVKQINTQTLYSVAPILADCYSKDLGKVKKNLRNIWVNYDLDLVKSFRGLAKLWQALARNLKVPDPVDIDKTEKLLEEFYERSNTKIPGFLDTIVKKTRRKVNEITIN